MMNLIKSNNILLSYNNLLVASIQPMGKRTVNVAQLPLYTAQVKISLKRSNDCDLIYIVFVKRMIFI